MNRTFVLPVSAAAIGILLAVGVSAAKRAAMNTLHDDGFVSVDIRRGELVDVEALVDGLEGLEALDEIEVRFDEVELVRDVMDEVRAGLQEALEDAELTEFEREEIQRALDELKAPPPAARADATSGGEDTGGN